jgi:hypothetical protein
MLVKNGRNEFTAGPFTKNKEEEVSKQVSK